MILREGKQPIIYYGHLEGGTNNTGELIGVIVGGALAKRVPDSLVLKSDSEYALGVLTKGWSINTNISLIQLGKGLLKTLNRGKISEFKWVKGHSNIYGNELADKYAKYGRDRQAMRPTDMQVRYFANTDEVLKFIEGAKSWDCLT